MGEGTKSNKVKSFRQEISLPPQNGNEEPSLIASQAVLEKHFVQCKSHPQRTPPSIGQEVKLIDNFKELILVFYKTQPIGEVTKSGTKLLRENLQIRKLAGNFLNGHVTKIDPTFGRFTVEISPQ